MAGDGKVNGSGDYSAAGVSCHESPGTKLSGVPRSDGCLFTGGRRRRNDQGPNTKDSYTGVGSSNRRGIRM